MNLNNVEIFDKGTWNGAKFVSEDLSEIVVNTNALISSGKIKQPSIKLGHSTNQILKGQTDGDPSLGHLENIRLSESGKIVADFIGVPDILVKAIEKGLYKQVSSELTFFKAFGWVVTAVAVLGADIPAVKTLEDLNNFMSDDFILNPVSQENQNQTLLFSTPVLISTETNEDIMSDELKKQLDEQKSAYEKLMSEKLRLEEQNKNFHEEKKTMIFSEKKNEILAQFKDDVKSGKIQPSLYEKIGNHIEQQKLTFSENSEITLSVELVREIANAFSDKLPKAETATEESQDEDINPIDALENAISKVQIETGKNYSEASDFVMESQPGIFKKYNEYISQLQNS